MKKSEGKGWSRAWRWRIAVAESDLDASTKHVLVELHTFMNGHGRKCFPPQTLLASRTSLSERTVRKHLAVAEHAGWIDVQKGRFEGKRNGLYSYAARWPDGVAEPNGMHRKMTTEGPENDD